MGKYISDKKEASIDWITPILMLFLALVGIAFIYSAQSYDIDEIALGSQFWIKQIFFVFFVGAPIYIFLGYIDYKYIFEYAHLIYFLCILSLLPMVLKEVFAIPVPFVVSRFNATRWIDLGFFSVQPSEIAKIGTCIMGASILARSNMDQTKDRLKVLLKLIFVFFVPILLIFLQPDLGSTLVFFPMLFAMLYISKIPKVFFTSILIVFMSIIALLSVDIYGYNRYLKENNMSADESASQNAYGSSALCLPLKDYQRNRLLAFVAPDLVDPRGQGVSWNHRQSLISVGSGGIFGTGWAQGTQAKLGYLPSSVAYNDFIFSVIAEETGFLGATTIIAIMATIVIYGVIRTAQISKDRFGQYLCIGISAILMTHIFINIGMTIGVMPITGLPLPMLSYGGTFVLTCCILLGLVQSIYRHRRLYS